MLCPVSIFVWTIILHNNLYNTGIMNDISRKKRNAIWTNVGSLCQDKLSGNVSFGKTEQLKIRMHMYICIMLLNMLAAIYTIRSHRPVTNCKRTPITQLLRMSISFSSKEILLFVMSPTFYVLIVGILTVWFCMTGTKEITQQGSMVMELQGSITRNLNMGWL